MTVLYAVVGVLVAVFLFLRIARMLGGSKTTVEYVAPPQAQAPAEKFSGDHFNTAPLPQRSAGELATQASTLKVGMGDLQRLNAAFEIADSGAGLRKL